MDIGVASRHCQEPPCQQPVGEVAQAACRVPGKQTCVNGASHSTSGSNEPQSAIPALFPRLDVPTCFVLVRVSDPDLGAEDAGWKAEPVGRASTGSSGCPGCSAPCLLEAVKPEHVDAPRLCFPWAMSAASTLYEYHDRVRQGESSSPVT